MKKIKKVLMLSTSLLLGGIVYPFSETNLVYAEDSGSIQTTSTSYQAMKSTFLRSGPGINYEKIDSISKGQIATADEKQGKWYKVTYTYYSNNEEKITKTGWISNTFLQEVKDIDTSGKYFFTKRASSLYYTAAAKGTAAKNISSNNGLFSTKKVINSKGETWYEVSLDEKTLYVDSSDVRLSIPTSFSQTYFEAKKDTYIYSSHGFVYPKLVKISKGQVVSSSLQIGKWYEVAYNGSTGYTYSNDFSALSEEALSGKTFLLKAKLDVRTEPSNHSSSLIQIPEKTIVVPTHKTSNGWYKVVYNGATGYISGSNVEEVKTGDPMTRDGYQFIDLRTPSPVTAEQINQFIGQNVAQGVTSVLIEKGQTFIDAGNKYGVNALYLAAHAIHESGYGTSNISLGKLNLFGFGAFDASPFISSYRFSSVDQNIEYIAQEMKATYLNPTNWKYKGAYLGFSTKTMNNTRIDSNSEGMNFYYASDPNWGKSIASLMERILPFNKDYYQSAAPNTVTFSRPAKPEGSDLFPTGVIAAAKTELVLNSQKGVKDSVAKINKDNEFMILEKTNDFWVRVKFEDKEYWTDAIKFDKYQDYLTVKNLGRVTTNGLNVRSTPSTSQGPIGTLKLNEYVQIVLDDSGNATMDPNKKWFKIQLTNGQIGWVSSTYINQELK